MLILSGADVLAPTPWLKDHPLSVVYDCLFSIFTVNLCLYHVML